MESTPFKASTLQIYAKNVQIMKYILLNDLYYLNKHGKRQAENILFKIEDQPNFYFKKMAVNIPFC